MLLKLGSFRCAALSRRECRGRGSRSTVTSPSLVACIYLRTLPIAAHHPAAYHPAAQNQAPKPLAVHRGRGRGARILYCNSLAIRTGVRPGHTLNAAKSREPSLFSRDFNAGLVQAHQRRITDRILRLSPRITHADASRMWVEPQRTKRMSLSQWCQLTQEALADHPPVAIGVALNSTIAWAAARSIQQGHRIIPPRSARAFLDECPIEVLDLGSEALSVLLSLGIRNVQQLRSLDPLSLNARFGAEVAEARRRADGWDPRTPQHPKQDTPVEVQVSVEYPLEQIEALLFLLAPATKDFLRQLRRKQLAARTVTLSLAIDSSAPLTLRIITARPITESRSLLELLRTRLEQISLPGSISSFTLRAEQVETAATHSASLFSSKTELDPAAEEAALDRLRHRLGPQGVRRASHRERTLQLERAAWCMERAPRRGQAMPWRGLHPPARLQAGRVRLAGKSRRVLHLGRVERLSSPWWETGSSHTEMLAWAELEGPLLVLLHGRRGVGPAAHQDDLWEVVAWVD